MQVTWKEALSNNAAWDTLTWFAALIGMASYLNKYGFIKWFSGKVGPIFTCIDLYISLSTCACNRGWHSTALFVTAGAGTRSFSLRTSALCSFMQSSALEYSASRVNYQVSVACSALMITLQQAGS